LLEVAHRREHARDQHRRERCGEDEARRVGADARRRSSCPPRYSRPSRRTPCPACLR
jgi:hypothetical protein